jgi:putative transposase
VTAHQAFHHVAAMCRTLDVSPSGYYASRKRPLSPRARADLELTAQIQAIYRESRGTYGAPRVHAELAAQGIHAGRKRLVRLMRSAGVHGVSRRKQFRTTVRDETARPAPDLVERESETAGPDRLWVADVTYVPTWAGFLYLAVVLDAWSRRIIGWAMEPHLRTELVLAALDMAVGQRRPTSVIHHSDQGCQHTSIEFGRRCREACVRPSMGSVGTPMTTRCARAFSRPLSASCSIAIVSASRRTPGSPSSTSSRAGTTRAVAILRSTISRPWFTREATRRASAERRQDRRLPRGVLSRYPRGAVR